jgi:hypothetical protein
VALDDKNAAQAFRNPLRFRTPGKELKRCSEFSSEEDRNLNTSYEKNNAAWQAGNCEMAKRIEYF